MVAAEVIQDRQIDIRKSISIVFPSENGVFKRIQNHE